MKKTLIPIAIATLLGLNSCSGEASQEKTPVKETVKALSYAPQETQIIWTGFKTTQKIGVTGQFTSFKVDGTIESPNIIDVFKNASITID